MRVVGKYIGEREYYYLSKDGYAAVEIQSATVDSFDGKSVENCNKCYIVICSGYLIYHIRKDNGEYCSAEAANNLIKDIAFKETVDLDLYNMAFFDVRDVRPDDIGVRNELDEDWNTIPLKVTIVN